MSKIEMQWFLYIGFAAAVCTAAANGGPAPPYTVAMKVAHMERVRQSSYVTPTPSADAGFVIGFSRGWRADDYPFDLDQVEDHMLTRPNRIPGNTRCFFASADGLDVPYAWTLEHANALSATRSREFGRAYALALYDVLLDGFKGEPTQADPPAAAPPAGPGTDAQALLRAAAQGDSLTVAALLDAGTKIAATDDRGYTALHLAAKKGQAETIRLLLTRGASIEHGANVNARHAGGDTPLHLAAAYNRGDIVGFLLDAGAERNVQGAWDRTPLEWAKRMGYHAVTEQLKTAE